MISIATGPREQPYLPRGCAASHCLVHDCHCAETQPHLCINRACAPANTQSAHSPYSTRGAQSKYINELRLCLASSFRWSPRRPWPCREGAWRCAWRAVIILNSWLRHLCWLAGPYETILKWLTKCLLPSCPKMSWWDQSRRPLMSHMVGRLCCQSFAQHLAIQLNCRKYQHFVIINDVLEATSSRVHSL